jgi:transcriptional regulator with XRE-family HTH domain
MEAIMSLDIKDIRLKTGLTQKKFAEMYGIPLGTLRRWEQGESTPPGYVIDLIARELPVTDQTLRKIEGRDGKDYFYNKEKHSVMDSTGNAIYVTEDLDDVKEKNLGLYISDLFESFYEIQSRFDRDCRYDKEEDIIWI